MHKRTVIKREGDNSFTNARHFVAFRIARNDFEYFQYAFFMFIERTERTNDIAGKMREQQKRNDVSECMIMRAKRKTVANEQEQHRKHLIKILMIFPVTLSSRHVCV
jgi:UDP-2,3-diacylglucosamine pyrophosphatase LpxH